MAASALTMNQHPTSFLARTWHLHSAPSDLPSTDFLLLVNSHLCTFYVVFHLWSLHPINSSPAQPIPDKKLPSPIVSSSSTGPHFSQFYPITPSSSFFKVAHDLYIPRIWGKYSLTALMVWMRTTATGSLPYLTGCFWLVELFGKE